MILRCKKQFLQALGEDAPRRGSGRVRTPDKLRCRRAGACEQRGNRVVVDERSSGLRHHQAVSGRPGRHQNEIVGVGIEHACTAGFAVVNRGKLLCS